MKKRTGKKLLVATLGVAAVGFVDCRRNEVTGNLVAPPLQEDAGKAQKAGSTDAAPNVIATDAGSK